MPIHWSMSVSNGSCHLRMSGVESRGAAGSSSFRVGKCPSDVNQYLPQMALILLLMQSENFSESLSHSDVGLCICILIGVCAAVGDQKSCAHKADRCDVVSRFHNFCDFCAFCVFFSCIRCEVGAPSTSLGSSYWLWLLL
jgi:hypothetical protein